MKARPIIFSGPMVEALLEWRKTQTRRVVKFPVKGCENLTCSEQSWPKRVAYYCPYGQPGDLLWVRETFAYYGPKTPVYKAAADPRMPWQQVKWRPSIYMPRWASRLTMRVADVRAERLQEISESDAKAEGCDDDTDPYWVPSYYDPDSGGHPSFVNSFHFLWDSINAELGYEWIANPWVWVVSFEVIQNNVDQILKGEA